MITIQEIIKKVKSYEKDADADLIKKAYETASEAHKDKKRASGEPFIYHPLEVANLVADFRMDTESVCAALLHDIIEEVDYPLGQIEKDFGNKYLEPDKITIDDVLIGKIKVEFTGTPN